MRLGDRQGVLPMMLAARVLACALCTLPLLSTVSATCTIDEDSLIAGSSLKCVSARARASGWPCQWQCDQGLFGAPR